MSEDFKSIWRLTKASMMVLCDQVESDGKMLKTEDLAGLRAAVDKLVMTPSISTSAASPNVLSGGEKEGVPSAISQIADARVATDAHQELQDSAQSSLQSSALTIVDNNTQLWSAMTISSSAVVQSPVEPDGHATTPPVAASGPAPAASSPAPKPAHQNAPEAAVPRMREFRRFTRDEHKVLNDAFVDCRLNGVTLKTQATQLAEQMNRPVRSIVNQLAPSVRCVHMPRDQWEEVMRASMTGHNRRYCAPRHHEFSQPHAGGEGLYATKSTQHDETECEEIDGDGDEDETPWSPDAESSKDKEDVPTSAPVGHHANLSTAAEVVKPAAPIGATSPSARDAHGDSGATHSRASDATPPRSPSFQESPDLEHGAGDSGLEQVTEYPVRPAPTEHSDGEDSLSITDSAQENPLPELMPESSASAASVPSQASSRGPERAMPEIRVISLAELQNLYARRSPVEPCGEVTEEGEVARENARLPSDDGVQHAFLARHGGSCSSSASSARGAGLGENGRTGEAISATHNAAQMSGQGSGAAVAVHNVEEDGHLQVSAAPSPRAALLESVEPQASDADHSDASALAGSNKRMADGDVASAASDVGHKAKRHKPSALEETAPGAAPQATSVSQTLAPARHGAFYTAAEEETILAAYKRCTQAGNTWSAEMDTLAVQLERTPRALKQRCVDLWWKQVWREKHL